MIPARRRLLGAIIATCTAPAIVRADSLMKIVVPRPVTILLATPVAWITCEDVTVSLAEYAPMTRQPPPPGAENAWPDGDWRAPRARGDRVTFRRWLIHPESPS